MFLMQLTTLHLEQMYAANDLLFFVAIQFVLGNIAFLGFDMSYVAIEHSKPDATFVQSLTLQKGSFHCIL